ncbi:hypothetical protein NC653_012824 [Populus alba x Populus x berolinensis]|uniref:Uncharacterized protein n=1 Tax=Populus alba x Populus x berolinensis TaxID=444605 RepID=A0AAD6QT88_9ROSI|nr:hypothetical protein NC653_012824 [Populus alba x Populus x berolinensis]
MAAESLRPPSESHPKENLPPPPSCIYPGLACSRSVRHLGNRNFCSDGGSGALSGEELKLLKNINVYRTSYWDIPPLTNNKKARCVAKKHCCHARATL